VKNTSRVKKKILDSPCEASIQFSSGRKKGRRRDRNTMPSHGNQGSLETSTQRSDSRQSTDPEALAARPSRGGQASTQLPALSTKPASEEVTENMPAKKKAAKKSTKKAKKGKK
jgi:hypothetical protein